MGLVDVSVNAGAVVWGVGWTVGWVVVAVVVWCPAISLMM